MTGAGRDSGAGSVGAVLGESLGELATLARRTADEEAGPVGRAAGAVVEALRSGGKVLYCGNGGSAADAQHLAAELVVRFRRRRRALPAVALTTDTSVLTAGGNDLGFEEVFARQVEALAEAGDVLVLHSTSGDSENLVRAADAARLRGVVTVAFLARGGGQLRGRVDHAVVVPTDSTARAQEVHLALGHVICEIVDRTFADAETPGTGRTPMTDERDGETLRVLEEGRLREKRQTLYYRRLAAEAEWAERAEDAERLNELHADEQHHLSRLTARALELGGTPADLRDVAGPEASLDGWEETAREREADEVRWYEGLLERRLDGATRAVVAEILESERHHWRELRGKWMSA